MSKVLVTGTPISDRHVERLEAHGFQVTNGSHAGKIALGLSGDDLAGDLTSEQTAQLVVDIDIYIYGGFEELGASVLAEATKLKLITFLGTGWDEPGCVDAESAERAGIVVTNTPHANAPSVAELAMGLIVVQSRDEFWLNKVAKSGEWIQRVTNDVSGNTLGVVGLGHIGLALARHAVHGFGMQVVYTGPRKKPDAESELNARYVSLEELLQTSDVVSIHSPGALTQGLIGSEQLNMMQSHAILINLAAPGVVDGEALYKALSSGSIRAASMDGKYNDELHTKLRKLDDDRFIIVPRTAWLTTDSYRRMADMSLQSIEDYVANVRPVHFQRLPATE